MSELAVRTLPVDPELIPPGTEITATAFNLPDGVPFNVWQRLGEALLQRHSRDQWMVAGWAAYGERTYRRDYGPAIQRLYQRESLWNMASVYRRIDPNAAREDLSFAHHAEVASMEPELQAVWLDDALRHGWSRDELRAQITMVRGGQRSPAPTLTFKAIGEVYDLCVRAAEKLHMDPGAFAKQALEEKAREVLGS